MHGLDNLVVCLGDINEHVGRHIDGVEGDGRHVIDQRNLKGTILVEFCV